MRLSFGGSRIIAMAEVARKASAAPRKPRTVAGRQESAEIRKWAQEAGLKVSGRGRIPASVIARYEAAS